MTALICAVLAAALFYFSQGIDAVWALAWVAPLPLLWLAYGRAPRWQVFAGGVAGYGAGQACLLPVYGMALLPTALAMTLGGGALFGGALLLARRMHTTLPPAAVLFGFPTLWTAIEYLAGLVSPHGSWGSLGYSQVAFVPAIQLASLLGVYGVTFLLCLFANAVALAARGERKPGAAGIALCLLALGFGAGRLAAAQGPAVRVAALGDEGENYLKSRHDPAAALRVTQEYADAVRAAKGTHFFVAPEGSVQLTPHSRATVLAPLAAAARATGSVVVVGAQSADPARDMAVAFLPDGRILDYDKRHLLLPLEAAFTPGHAPGLLGQGRAMAICKDMDFPRTLGSDARQGAIRIIAVPAGDFGLDNWIHARMAIMRGVENGFAVVRSAFNGLETVSDAQGRVIAAARIDHAGLIVTAAAVALGPGPTLYTRIGDVFSWACLMASAGLLGWAARKPHRP